VQQDERTAVLVARLAAGVAVVTACSAQVSEPNGVVAVRKATSSSGTAVSSRNPCSPRKPGTSSAE